MANTMTATRTVVGLFDSIDQANRAADELRKSGVDSSHISIVAGNESNRYNDYVHTEDKTSDAAEPGRHRRRHWWRTRAGSGTDRTRYSGLRSDNRGWSDCRCIDRGGGGRCHGRADRWPDFSGCQ